MVYKTIVPYFFQMGEHVQHYAGGSISDDFLKKKLGLNYIVQVSHRF